MSIPNNNPAVYDYSITQITETSRLKLRSCQLCPHVFKVGDRLAAFSGSEAICEDCLLALDRKEVETLRLTGGKRKLVTKPEEVVAFVGQFAGGNIQLTDKDGITRSVASGLEGGKPYAIVIRPLQEVE